MAEEEPRPVTFEEFQEVLARVEKKVPGYRRERSCKNLQEAIVETLRMIEAMLDAGGGTP